MYRCNSCDTPAEMGHHDDCPIHERVVGGAPPTACPIGVNAPGLCPDASCAICVEGHRPVKINIASGEDVIPHDYL